MHKYKCSKCYKMVGMGHDCETKTKDLNERVAVGLEWKWKKGDTISVMGRLHTAYLWSSPGGNEKMPFLPDFKNDLNACFKYVWPELVDQVDIEQPVLLMNAFMGDTPAKVICEAFLEMKEKK